MKRLTGFLLGITFFIVGHAQKKYVLAEPQLHASAVFFDGGCMVEMSFRQAGAQIHYTIDGSEPTESSPVYERPVIVTKPATIRARSMGKSFLPSGIVSLQVFNKGLPFTVTSVSHPSEKYMGRREATLFDNQTGNMEFDNGEWLGFSGDSVVIEIERPDSGPVHSLMLHSLSNQGSWIFLPQKVQVYDVDKHEPKLIGSLSRLDEREEPAAIEAITIPLQTKAKNLRIIAYPVASIPAWHAGSGNRAWLFFDEIKIY